VIYIGAGDGNLYALNGGSGAIVWHYHAGGQVSSPVAGQ
jgi:outer membrane protein assembly factor BamB